MGPELSWIEVNGPWSLVTVLLILGAGVAIWGGKRLIKSIDAVPVALAKGLEGFSLSVGEEQGKTRELILGQHQETRGEVRLNSILTLSMKSQLLGHDLTVRGVNDAVDGDGTAALQVYRDVQRDFRVVLKHLGLPVGD